MKTDSTLRPADVHPTELARVTVDTAALIRALSACRLTMSSGADVRYYLAGVCFESDERETHLIATDGHRLTAVPLHRRLGSTGQVGSAIIPRADVPRLIKWLRGAQKVEGGGGTQIVVWSDGFEFWCGFAGLFFECKRVAGEFPLWRRVLPMRPTSRADRLNITFDDPRELLRALDRIADACKAAGADPCGAVRIEQTADGLKISQQAERRTFRENSRLITRGKNAGQRKTWREIDTVETLTFDAVVRRAHADFGFAVGFAAAYLRGFMHGPRSPVTMWAPDGGKYGPWEVDAPDRFTRVIMPMRV